MSSIDTSVGKRLAEAREAVGLSQRGLAEYSGISQPTIQRIETGVRAASLMELSLVADASGVLVADLQGANQIAEQVLCAGRMSDSGSPALIDYLLYAFGVDQRLNELGLVDVA